MSISKIKMVWKFLFGGGVSGVVEYLLELLKTGLSSLSDTTKEKIQGALNFAKKILATLTALKWLVPTKWQTAYDKTLAAVEEIVDSLSDLEVTSEELDAIVNKIVDAVKYWKADDDETCVDCVAK
jgi:hypothetical protein